MIAFVKMTSIGWLVASSSLVWQLATSLSAYEEKYSTLLRYRQPDEITHQPLEKLAFGSCQKIHLNPKRIYDSIVRYEPDMFLFTGDIVYAPNGCCNPQCLKTVYDELLASPVYQEFAESIKSIDGIYDDHDFGINDGHGTYEYKEYSQQYLLDFLKKPKEHYRRKRQGSYFSILFRDEKTPKKNVKLIVLDARYHRSCYYHCPCLTCEWNPCETNKFIYHRLVNYIFGFGWDHDGDALGEEQWRWLEGQLHNSEAESHIIVSSMQIFTRYPITESWGLLPKGKQRLVDLLLETKPKNPIFISGDVHYGVVDVMDGVVEITASSLTHSIIEHGKSIYSPFALSVYFTRKKVYMYNNFGGVEYVYDEKTDALKWTVNLFNEDGEVVDSFVGDTSRDPRAMYSDIHKKSRSFFKDVLLVKPRSLVFKSTLVYFIICVLSWMVLIPYIVLHKINKRWGQYSKDKVQ